MASGFLLGGARPWVAVGAFVGMACSDGAALRVGDRPTHWGPGPCGECAGGEGGTSGAQDSGKGGEAARDPRAGTGGGRADAGSAGDAGEAGQAGGATDGGRDACSDVSCGENAVCEDAAGEPRCLCLSGYEFVDAACSDVDECATDAHECEAPASCENLPGGYACRCPPQLARDGRSCVPHRRGLDFRPPGRRCIVPELGERDATPLSFRPAFAPLSFTFPVTMSELPGALAGSFLVAEQDGAVHWVDGSSVPAISALVLDLSPRINQSLPNGASLVREVNWELGLLGLAVHPDFPDVPELFVSYNLNVNTSVAPLWAFRLSRFRWLGVEVDPAGEEVLLELALPGPHHHGGTLGFDPSGQLMLAIGEGDVPANAQRLDNLFGKMLRIDVNGADPPRNTPYRIPDDNPFARGGGAPEIWAFGLRNPWKWSFDRLTGDLWLGDVGLDRFEEINIVTAGGNYGWPFFEGPECRNAPACVDSALVPPVHAYAHDGFRYPGGAHAVTGGYVYRGSAIPELYGTYVFAEFGQGLLLGTRDSGGEQPIDVLGEQSAAIASLAEDSAGELYVLPYAQNAQVSRVVRSVQGDRGPAPLLSQTGCVEPNSPAEAASGLIPYDINVPFWSDSAGKTRWLSLPESGRIDVAEDGDFALPVGSVLMKTFERGGRRIETRLLMHHRDGWAGYSYEWDEAQTDAHLLTLGRTVGLSDGPWTFPSRRDCMACHTSAAGDTLGLEASQMNRNVHYPRTGRYADQLSTLEAIGLFETEGVRAAAGRLVPLDDTTASPAERARSYLHANCSHCHRPGGVPGLELDFRYRSDLGVCNVRPARGDLGIPGALLVKPGVPDESLVPRRIGLVGPSQMPPLARSQVDVVGLSLVRDWIASLESCSD